MVVILYAVKRCRSGKRKIALRTEYKITFSVYLHC